VIAKLKAFGAFWYDFVVGDDWRVALSVVTALAITYGASQLSTAVWWILPLVVAIVIPLSLRRATRRR
jgi:hypothetical protein